MNVISLKTTTSGTLYTCPAGTVAEVELVAIEAGIGGLEVISNSIGVLWAGAGAVLLVNSFTQTSGQGSASSDNSFVEDIGNGIRVLHPKFVKLTAGDTIRMSSVRRCTLIIYEEKTGIH